MGVVLYRRGDTHTVRGVRCELKVVDSRHFSGTPDAGWFLNVRDIDKVEKPEVKEVATDLIVEEPTVPETVKTIDGMDNDEIRVAAKMAKMNDYDTARIRTLKHRLKAKECRT